MELRHHFAVPASLDETWALFDDIGAVASCFPGAAVEPVSDDRCEGTVKVKLGPISVSYNGAATRIERDAEARRIKIEAAGKDKRGQGTATAILTVELEADGARTAVDVATDLAITGKPAQFGRGMIQDVSDKYLGQFVATVSERLRPPAEATPSTAAASVQAVPPAAPELDVLSMAVPELVRRNAVALAALSGVLTLLVLARTITRGRS